MINSPTFVEARFHQFEIAENSFHEENIRLPFQPLSDKNECYFHLWEIHSSKVRNICIAK